MQNQVQQKRFQRFLFNFDQFMEVIQYTKLDVCFLFLLIKYDTLKSILSKP